MMDMLTFGISGILILVVCIITIILLNYQSSQKEI